MSHFSFGGFAGVQICCFVEEIADPSSAMQILTTIVVQGEFALQSGRFSTVG
jgi:hypothetical protein